jgi:hypothetical protein
MLSPADRAIVIVLPSLVATIAAEAAFLGLEASPARAVE